VHDFFPASRCGWSSALAGDHAGFHRGRPPRNKGLQYPADPPTVEEIVAVMRCAGDRPYGLRTRALVVLFWRSGLRITEALSLAESDLDSSRSSVLVRCGKGGKRREVGMGHWAWQHLDAWIQIRVRTRVGALLCVIDGPTQCRPWPPTAARATRRELAVGSPRTSSDTRTPSRWPAKASP
jgi:integrase